MLGGIPREAVKRVVLEQLEPARNAWLVSHPVSRTGILLGRFLGCLVIATLSAVFTFGGAWAVVGMKTNVWHLPFFFGVATTLLLYVSLASAMLLLQLVSSSPMLMATGLAAVAALNGAVARPEGLKAVAGTGRIHDVVVSMAEILPRPVDVASLTDVYVQTGRITHYQYLWTPALFCVICLGLASWRFSRKNL